tara:strand:+ start:915 stop:1775 length:861 start_codon:yes stop_codon:yes gene_type:complete
MTEENNTGNPLQEGSSDDFFDALENNVNSAIQDRTLDETTEVTPPSSDPEQATHEKEGSNNAKSDVDWETRYKDSTREAQKIHTELSELKPFVPVLNAMKNDSGLVDHVRDYLENGGAPSKTVTENLGLDEDFVYDPDEAVKDPESDSAKVFEHSVDKIVNTRVQQMLQNQQAQNDESNRQRARAQEEVEFKKKHNMSDEDFGKLMDKSKQHVMTLDDIHYLINRDQVSKNTAKSTKDDMLKQMKNVRNIPTSASGANSAKGDDKSFEDNVFDALAGEDDVDNLFG